MARPPASDDDAALRWDEFDDPSYVESDAAIAARDEVDASSEGDASGASRDVADRDAAHDAPASIRSSAGTTLLTALFAVVYLAYSVGWIIGIGLVPLSGPTLLIEIMYQFSEFLAIIASALWFGAVVALTRGGRAVHRFGWLALGALVLLPWPFVLGLLR